MTRKRLLRELGGLEELIDWMAMWELEPFGDERRQQAITAAAAANSQICRKKGDKFFDESDFLPAATKPEQRIQSDEEIERQLYRALGGK